MVITFAGALQQALVLHLNAELFSCADGTLAAASGGDTKHRRAGLVLFPPAQQFIFITNWWMSKI